MSILDSWPTQVLQNLPLLIDAEDCRRDFRKFVAGAWPVLEPTTEWLDNWHVDCLAEHLQAVQRREILRLLINISPRCSKSTLISVMYPAFVWASDPSEKFLTGSFKHDLALRDSSAMRDLILSPWYQDRWGHKFTLSASDNAKGRYQNNKRGSRVSFSSYSPPLGDGAGLILLDDPHSTVQAESDVQRQTVLDNFDRGIMTRQNRKDTAVCVVMQRINAKDLSGHILEKGGFEHVMIPMRYEGARSKITSIGWKDPRTVEGQLMWPERFPESKLKELEKDLGAYAVAGQLQQRPAPAGGGDLDVTMFRMWPGELPEFERIVQSYDTAFTDKTINDPTAWSDYGVFQWNGKPAIMVLDADADHLTYPELVEVMIQRWSAKYGKHKVEKMIPNARTGNLMKPGQRADSILIELKASGQSLVQDLRLSNLPITPFRVVDGGKRARASLAAPILESIPIWIPESKKFPGKFVSWAYPFLEQLEQFPNAEHDDLVDTFTQAMIHLKRGGWFEVEQAEDKEKDLTVDYHAQAAKKKNPYAN